MMIHGRQDLESAVEPFVLYFMRTFFHSIFHPLSSFSGLSDTSVHAARCKVVPVRCLPSQLLRQGRYRHFME
jgi:hypothetical protein